MQCLPTPVGQQWAPTLPVRVCLLGSNWEAGADLLFPESRKRTRFQGAQPGMGVPFPGAGWAAAGYLAMSRWGTQVLKAKTLLPGRRAPAPLGQGWGCLCARSSP